MTVTLVLLTITVFVSFYAMERREWKHKMMLIPYQIQHEKGQTYRFFSHMLVHADWMHLLFNMYVLYAFGDYVETYLKSLNGDVIGETRFLLLYVGGGLFASLLPFFRNRNNPSYMSLGASGAVSAIVFACIILGPQLRMGLLFLPIMIPGYLFGILYLAFEFYMDKRGNTGVAHDAHIGGSIFGVLFIVITQPQSFQQFIEYITH